MNLKPETKGATMPSAETTTEATRRRNTRPAKDIAKEAAKEAAREAIFEMNLESEEAEPDLSALDGNSDPTQGEAAAGFDLFEDVGKALTEKGEVVKYIIKRNGERVGSKYHPYSWEKLAKEYGNGHFQVMARSESTNRFVKSQTQMVGNNEEASDEITHTQAQGAPQVPWQQPQMNFMEMLNLIQGQSDRAKSEANIAAQQQAQTQVAMITMMTEMMKSSQNQSQQVFMEMTKMTASVTEKIAQSQEKMFERINDRVDKIAELATKKPEGPGWLEIMKMQADSQNKGFELFEKITRLAELKADEKVELLEAGKGDEPAKKSMTDSLIESLLPAITTAMVNNNSQAAQLAAMQQGQLTQRPQPRRAVRPPQSFQGQRPERGAVQPQQRTAPQGNGAPNKVEEKRDTEPSSPIIENGGEHIGEVLVMPKQSKLVSKPAVVKDVSPVVAVAAQVEESVTDKVEVIDTSEVEWTKETLKEKCAEILPMFLGNQMLDKASPDAAALKTVDWLHDHDIGLEVFAKWIVVDDFLSFAREFNLPEEAHQWLNELYANLQSLAGNDVRKESRGGS
jgi:hypothetical protein